MTAETLGETGSSPPKSLAALNRIADIRSVWKLERDFSTRGSRAALEVRARDVPFMVEHGQPVCKLAFERMAEEPDVLYGADVGSNYQGQQTMLSKHFLGQTLPVTTGGVRRHTDL